MRQFDSEYPDWSSKISKYTPKINLHQDTLQLYANFMVIIAVLNMIPLSSQAFVVYKTKEVKGLSIIAFIFQIIISSLWLIYALMTRNGVIVVSSSLIILAASTLVFLIWKYTPVESSSDN